VVRWILQEAAQTAKRSPLFADTYGQLARRRGTNIATVAIARRLLARSFHILTQLEQHRHRRRPVPGALASLHEPATRPPGLTEQPGPDSTVMRPRPGVRMGAWESSPRRRLGLLVHDPVPVLAGVRVFPPPGRFTLTRLRPANPAATGSQPNPAYEQGEPSCAS
jgi:hypothetical protein